MRRTLDVNGERWVVYPSGRVTVYARDEFGLIFEKGTGPDRVRRVARYAPLGSRQPDAALGELSTVQLEDLFHHSQSDRMSPDTKYAGP
ncbi:MAG TPA: hypothetical protein VGA37_02920 [Gemmatimonadales bacterium]